MEFLGLPVAHLYLPVEDWPLGVCAVIVEDLLELKGKQCGTWKVSIGICLVLDPLLAAVFLLLPGGSAVPERGVASLLSVSMVKSPVDKVWLGGKVSLPSCPFTSGAPNECCVELNTRRSKASILLTFLGSGSIRGCSFAWRHFGQGWLPRHCQR